jgi:putative ABC transport system permease protein
MTHDTRRLATRSVLDAVWQDTRLALRMVQRSPGFAALIVLTLALGVGVNAAVFGVIDTLLLRPLPVSEPHRLATVSSERGINAGYPAGFGWNLPMWDRFQPHVSRFDGAIAWLPTRFDLSQGGERQPAEGLFASGSYFTTLGLQAWRGRLFTQADDRPGGGPDGLVAVVSYGLWQRRFGGADHVIGAPLLVDGVSLTIVGVAPPTFYGVEVGRPFDLAVPLQIEPLLRGARSQLRAYRLAVMLRLQPGQSTAAGSTILRALQPAILGVTPEQMSSVNPSPLRDPFILAAAPAGTSGATGNPRGLRQAYGRPLLAIFAVVLLVLLIACVNIANLLLARATARRHELSVRLALGASRLGLARQLLIESLLLAGPGALLGLLFAVWSGRALVAQLSTPVHPIALDLSPGWRVLAFTAIASLLTAALFGSAPALRATRLTPMDALQGQGRGAVASTGGRSGLGRLASGLVVLQMALSLVIVIAAALFVGTFQRLTNVPLGFDRQGVLVVNVETARAHVDPDGRAAFHQRLVDAVRTAPGVAGAGGSLWTPIDGGMRIGDPRTRVQFNLVTPGLFGAYKTAIRAGRDFTVQDSAEAPPVVIVNQSAVRALLAGRPPLDATISCPGGPGGLPCRIVGVVDDAVTDSQRDGTLPIAYLPLAQSARLAPAVTEMSIAARTAGPAPIRLTPQVAAALAAVDPAISFAFRPLSDQVDAAIARERLLAALSGMFGVLALVLASLGLYGVTSYAVGRRTPEIGIRMALGAQRSDVLALVFRRSLLLTGVGLVLGLGAAASVTRYLRGMLFGLTPLDLATFAGVALLFAAVTTLATWIPARRATRIDPLAALRCD